MSTGVFILKVRQSAKERWSELERCHYDDLARLKADRRDGKLEEMRSRKSGWISRYHRFRDAAFRIVEETHEGHKIIDGAADHI